MASSVREPVEHDLKIWPEYFEAVDLGWKSFEIRRNDRGFRVNDILLLREWNPTTKDYTGRTLRRQVTYVLSTLELDPDYVCMSLAYSSNRAGSIAEMKAQVEILGPSGTVHYRRPCTDPIVIEALETPGYSLRWPYCVDVKEIINALPAKYVERILRSAKVTVEGLVIPPATGQFR